MTRIHQSAPDMHQHGWPRTVGIIGAAGTVGSALLYRLVESGLVAQVFAADLRGGLLAAHALDIAESAALNASRTRLTVVDVDACPAVDLLIVAAAVAEDPGVGRHAYTAANWRVVEALLPTMVKAIGSTGIAVLVTNPVDVIAELVRRTGAVPSHRLVGYNLNDSVRFRIALGDALAIDPGRIDGWVLGEHGGIQVPLFSLVRVDGEPIAITRSARDAITTELQDWFARWARLAAGRSSGWTTATGVAYLCERIRDEATVPVSVAADGYYDLPAAYLTLPARIGRRGVERVEVIDLQREERRQLERAAASVGAAVDAVLRLSPSSIHPT